MEVIMSNQAYEKVKLARDPNRFKAQDFIDFLFDDFIEFHGDRLNKDDQAIIGGIALFHNRPVTIIAEAKGKDLEENLKRNFGMVSPQGYRKAMRLAKQAEKFKRPIITFIDTSGAYPGVDAEANGQGEAIASCLSLFSNLKTIVIGVVISEGGSGGALALSVGDRLLMLENAVYSILSPEGFASILFKDSSRVAEAAQLMKLEAENLKEIGFVDEIISEGDEVFHEVRKSLVNNLNILSKQNIDKLVQKRYEKFRKIGTVYD